LEDLKVVRKLRRNRPLNSLKGECREAAVESRGEASQIGEAVNESRGEALIHFAESSKGERTDEIFGGDFTKFREPLDLPEVRGSYSASVERF
jgi:hypothetical protein